LLNSQRLPAIRPLARRTSISQEDANVTHHSNRRAALQVAIVVSILTGTALLHGCAMPVPQINTTAPTTPTVADRPTASAVPTAPATAARPTATAVGGVAETPTATSITGRELTSLGCVCHAEVQQDAPPLAEIAALPDNTIREAVRQGPRQMPVWSEQSLSDERLAEIIGYLKSSQQSTPSPAASE
jgi:hypothetical protein